MINCIAFIFCIFVALAMMDEDQPLTVAACLFMALLNLPFAYIYLAS